jgi:hypothetical protein
MKKYFITVFLMLIGLAVSAAPVVWASPPALTVPSTLAIAEIKITGDEFIVLRNNTGSNISDLSIYWLNYFNSYSPFDPGVSSSSQQLPAIGLNNGQTILLNSNGMATCGAAAISKLSISLSDSSGYLQISQMGISSLGISQIPVDYVSWSSSTGTSAKISSVPSSTKDPKGLYYRYASGGSYVWQLADLDSTNACQLNVATVGSINTGLTPPTSPVPSVIGVSGASINLPSDDIGLAVPQISEILANPAPPQTDANDEFIELYNSNDKAFDLSGFVLQVGTTTVHKYTFPDGTSIEPHQFSAFYSSDTGLSLSNSDGQVKLLDPGGNVLEQTDQYTKAPDGYAWVNADGLWQWTTTPTPGAANIITTPPSAKVAGSTSAKSAVKGAKTSAGAASNSSYSPSKAPSAVKMHPLVLAGVGVGGLLYALYEYRHDLANQLYKFRRYREARRTSRQIA